MKGNIGYIEGKLLFLQCIEQIKYNIYTDHIQKV